MVIMVNIAGKRDIDGGCSIFFVVDDQRVEHPVERSGDGKSMRYGMN